MMTTHECNGCELCNANIAAIEAACLAEDVKQIPQLRLEVVALERAARGVKSEIVRRRCRNEAAAKRDLLTTLETLVALSEAS